MPCATKWTWVAHFFVLGSLMVIFELGLLYTGKIRNDIDLEHGPRIMGTIVGLHSYLGSHNKACYQLIVQFPANGRLVKERVEVDGDEYVQSCIGSKTLVTYARRGSSVVCFGAMTPTRADHDIAVQAARFLLVTAVLLLGSYFIEDYIRLPVALLRIGLPATATIERAEPGKHGVLVVTYAFQAEGRRWKGSESDTANWKFKPKPGVMIPILYLPGKPKRNAPLTNVLKLAHLRDRSIFDRS